MYHFGRDENVCNVKSNVIRYASDRPITPRILENGNVGISLENCYFCPLLVILCYMWGSALVKEEPKDIHPTAVAL